MITVQIRSNGFTVKGHAEYAEEGKDIVCSAVSAITQTATLGLMHYADCEVEMREAYLNVSVIQGIDDAIHYIISTMNLGLRKLAKQYPENVVITV